MRALKQCSAPHTLQISHHNGAKCTIQKAQLSGHRQRMIQHSCPIGVSVGSVNRAGSRLGCAAAAVAAPSAGSYALTPHSLSYGSRLGELVAKKGVRQWKQLASSRMAVVCGSGAAAAGGAGDVPGQPGIGDKVVQWLTQVLQVTALSG
jgi:hypothetical protein